MAMTAIAKRVVFRVLATAQRDGFRFGNIHFARPEAGAFVRTVTERLLLRRATRAPPKGAGLGFLNKWRSLGNNWFHDARTIFKPLQNANRFHKKICFPPLPVRSRLHRTSIGRCRKCADRDSNRPCFKLTDGPSLS